MTDTRKILKADVSRWLRSMMKEHEDTLKIRKQMRKDFEQALKFWGE